MAGGPLRNFFSGVAQSPVSKAIGDTPAFFSSSPATSLARNKSMTGYDAQFRPINTATPATQKMSGGTNMTFSSQWNKAGTPSFGARGGGVTQFKPTTFASPQAVAMKGFMGSSPFMTRQRGNITLPVVDTIGLSNKNNSTVANLGGAWSKIDGLNDWIVEAGNAHNVDPNLIKAVMKLESGGEWIISHAGAIGYMQVMDEYWGDLGYDLNDPRQNIMAGANVLRIMLDENGGDVYEALRHYHGIGFDGFTTDQRYADVIMGHLKTLQDAGGTYYGGGTSGGLGSGWGVMFGSAENNVSQEMGLTAFAQQHLDGMYAYATAYGITGHAGVDVAIARGSQLFAPASGTVITSGGTGYYCDTGGCGRGQGELKLKLDNGDELILGHMSFISVAVGDRVQIGQSVGKTGTQNGDHVHVEYRTPDSTTSSGWRAIDPRGGQGLSGEAATQQVQLTPPEFFINPAVRGAYSQRRAGWTPTGQSSVFLPRWGQFYDGSDS